MRAHDVRRLQLCAHCRRPGLPEELLQTPVGLQHGRCARQSLGAAGLVALPAAERGKITLKDVEIALMKQLLDAADRPTPARPRIRAGSLRP